MVKIYFRNLLPNKLRLAGPLNEAPAADVLSPISKPGFIRPAGFKGHELELTPELFKHWAVDIFKFTRPSTNGHRCAELFATDGGAKEAVISFEDAWQHFGCTGDHPAKVRETLRRARAGTAYPHSVPVPPPPSQQETRRTVVSREDLGMRQGSPPPPDPDTPSDEQGNQKTKGP